MLEHAGAAVALLLVAGCAGHERRLTTQTVAATVRAAGFHQVGVLSERARARALARKFHRPLFAKGARDVDWVFLKSDRPDGLPRFGAIRYESVAAAKGDGGDAGREGTIQVLLEPGRYRSARVCNVVVFAYEPRAHPAFGGRYSDVVRALRKEC
jgi:hypothetical protein